MLEKTNFAVYLDAIDPRDPEWLRDRIIGQAAKRILRNGHRRRR